MDTAAPPAAAFRRRTRSAREEQEALLLAPAATRSAATRGRVRDEAPDPDRTCFERDRDRILHSKAFRRLKHKTQVFLNPEGDHALGLNEPLAEAIALAHDVGHTPFGHTGEEALEPYVPGGWHHAAQGVRIYTVLEDLNLTWEVRDGIRAHTWRIEPPPATPEARCVRFADRIAYLTHDALDAVRAGMLAVDDLPADVRAHLGPIPGSAWINRMITAVVDETLRAGELTMEAATAEAMATLRAFLFERVYTAGENARAKRAAVTIIRQLVDHHLRHPEALPDTYRDTDADLQTQVIDYVAGMTDRYALALHDRLFRPRLFDWDPADPVPVP
jgi:dGTPase